MHELYYQSFNITYFVNYLIRSEVLSMTFKCHGSTTQGNQGKPTRDIKLSNTHQTTNHWLHDLCLRSLNMVMSCACFEPRRYIYSNYWSRATDIVAVGTIFNVYSYDVVLSRDSNPLPSWWRASVLRVCLTTDVG